ncbi:citramalate synthase [Oleidesulfovibrio sp.]|uniref:citramalate synthase n=1 Tax=Oleidesulfovibrio sp. TaxID=2909707 RepID=UPI003A8B33C2
MKQIEIYDTTLRDGTQAEDINLSTEDKIKIALKLDELGVRYIEGGWPGSNPVDRAFFNEITNYAIRHARITAFGSTHHPNFAASEDPNLRAIIESGVQTATIFGKSWDIHVNEALRIPLERNLEIIHDSVAYLHSKLNEVLFDAEHFFDGYKANPEYALAALRKAHEAGARVLVLCDTNGGSLPSEVFDITAEVRKALPDATLGIHTHNDCELAVANSIAAVQAGAEHIQGTINGVGERCGNANLCSIIPTLEQKFPGKHQCLPEGHLQMLTRISHFVSEVANVQPFSRQPFVGRSAFAHKGGIHASAVNRMASLYEHMDPEVIGNRQRVLLTELAGRSNIVSIARRFGFHLEKDEPVVKGLLKELKDKASLGYDYAAAEASVELLLFRKLARRGVRQFFRLINFRVLESKQGRDDQPMSEATVIVEVEGIEEHTAASGMGPVNALDNALRKALSGFYPRLNEMRLLDFKVRVLTGAKDEKGSTASVVRVLIESGDQHSRWVTVGVSFNIIEASWQALVDSITYKLYKDECEQRSKLNQ